MAKFLISGTCARCLSKDLHRCACFDTASALLNFHRSRRITSAAGGYFPYGSRRLEQPQVV